MISNLRDGFLISFTAVAGKVLGEERKRETVSKWRCAPCEIARRKRRRRVWWHRCQKVGGPNAAAWSPAITEA